ncbi:unnamed protein product [Bursaphelenchus xylophilus]|uniref:(pine wood nematode) hypothetical protein n=1 Tax=Bursaphelenchus xylophilus TaxID=6326 RepID=A0A1I7RNW0_BURXY|nr:unnamed protein product [Bursaphelenchus xylophilus]CAG9124334.1 unnamed protein product [Bursaphelenchus xylophilus]
MVSATEDDKNSGSELIAKSGEEKQKDNEEEPESLLVFFLQATPALILAALGTIFTGYLYNIAEGSEFFSEIREAFMVAPPILGLKGNIEMTLVSRLSTMAHRKSTKAKWKDWFFSLYVNLTLLWTQAFFLTVATCLLTSVALAFENTILGKDVIILFSSALTSTTLAAVILGTIMCFLVCFSIYIKANPDNIATPLSASASDVVTLTLFMYIGTGEIKLERIHYAINLIPIILNIIMLPGMIYVAFMNDDTRPTLLFGWTFLVLAVLLSSLGGYIFKWASAHYPNSVIFQPLLSSLCGNRASIMCSRLSTEYNVSNEKKTSTLNDSLLHLCSPVTVFGCKDSHSKCGVLLIVTAVPFQWLFVIVLSFIYKGPNEVWFMVMLVAASLVQVTFLIYLSHCLVALFSRFDLDPDNCTIPVITSLGDLTGAGMLYFVCFIAHKIVPQTLETPI